MADGVSVERKMESLHRRLLVVFITTRERIEQEDARDAPNRATILASRAPRALTGLHISPNE
jgi:hypothetical protein